MYTETLHPAESFMDTASRFADLPGTVLLMSGGDPDCARYHILGILPWLVFSGRGCEMRIETGGETLEFGADPFETLRMILKVFRLEKSDAVRPLECGLLGYLAYDLKDRLERLPRTSVDDLCLPHIRFYAPSVILIHDRQTQETRLCMPEREGTDTETVLANFRQALAGPPPEPRPFRTGNDMASGFTRSAYMDAVGQIREYIRSGDVYQVNLSQRFAGSFSGDAFSLFRRLYDMNPAPFFAWVQAGDHQIISTSPERFVSLDGQNVETRPIKGTRPRGETAEQDRALADELEKSRKDDAELSMIVDLMRNDIGRVCEAGSVQVREHKRLEPYRNVWHLVSVVSGRLDAGQDAVDLLRATFPGGSITGCPKIRSMEIIDELEPVRRHIYTGSIGYISFHDTMDLSIAIRTATVHNGRIVFSVGGGIVHDSDPADEYAETLHKGRTLTAALGCDGAEGQAGPYLWMNGSFRPPGDAGIPVHHPGFLYGYGIFETIRADRGKIFFLREHMDRFAEGWRTFFPGPVPDLDWEAIVAQVLERNCLNGKRVAVRITAAKGDRETAPFNHSLLVTARPYVHRLAEKAVFGIRLATCEFPRQTPLSRHKTLNYLYYYMTGNAAKEAGADEALILNPDGTVSETNTANILLVTGRTVRIPGPGHALPGIMQAAVCKWFSSHQFDIIYENFTPEALFTADEVLLTNSLMGAVPVLSLDNRPLATPSERWRQINRELLCSEEF